MRPTALVLTVAPAVSAMLLWWPMTYPHVLTGQLVRIKCQRWLSKGHASASPQLHIYTLDHDALSASCFVYPGAEANACKWNVVVSPEGTTVLYFWLSLISAKTQHLHSKSVFLGDICTASRIWAMDVSSLLFRKPLWLDCTRDPFSCLIFHEFIRLPFFPSNYYWCQVALKWREDFYKLKYYRFRSKFRLKFMFYTAADALVFNWMSLWTTFQMRCLFVHGALRAQRILPLL